MSTDYLPRKDRDFLAWVINLLKTLFPSMKRFNFPETEYTKLSSECDDYKQKLKTAGEPSTRTTVTVEIKKKARKTLETSVRTDVKAYLMYNPLVNGEDRISMGLPVHKTTRDPSSVATTYPDFDIDSSMIRRLTIHFYDRGQKKSKAKPAGQRGAVIRWVISDKPVVNVDELIHSSFDTRTPFTLEFQGHERGKTVYFCLCWENTRGERGPWGEIQSAIIP